MRVAGIVRAAIAVLMAAAATGASPAGAATPVTIIDETTDGFYNVALGTSLDGTGPQFLCANSTCGDPTANFPAPAGEPDLSAASGILGGWLSDPPLLGPAWSGPQPIPAHWPVNSESAIVYEINSAGLSDVTASLGVDNGIFVWLDGVYQFGAMAPGGAFPGEYTVDLGDLAAGTHHLQILREDHGGATGYQILVTGTPNSAPDCSGVAPSVTSLWPPNHAMAPVSLSGATDADGDAVVLSVTGVTQDEPVNGLGSGGTGPDASIGPSPGDAQLRAEREGGGDGRVYRLSYTAMDAGGASCSGVALVQVPHDRRGAAAVDSLDVYDSTIP